MDDNDSNNKIKKLLEDFLKVLLSIVLVHLASEGISSIAE